MLKQLRDRQWMSTAIARLQALAGKPKERQRAVYVVQYGELYKIGLSVDPVQRLRMFMLPEVVATMRVYWLPFADQFERHLHRKFAIYREHGEWFKLPASAFAEMDQAAERWKTENLHAMYLGAFTK